MRAVSAIATLLLLLIGARLGAQSFPFNSKDPNLQETLEFIFSQGLANKAAIKALVASSGVTSVTASSPLSSSGGNTPNISLTGTIPGSSITGNIAGNAGTATALAATPTAAPANYVCRGIAASGNCLTAVVDSTFVSASTDPVQGGLVTAQFNALATSTTSISVATTTLQTNINAKISTVTADATYISGIGSASSPLTVVSGSLDTSRLATDAVATVKILNLAVTTAKLADSSVDTNKLANGSVTSGKILDGTIAAVDLGSLGITSACASGFHLSTVTVNNGIITGGSCVSDSSGASFSNLVSSASRINAASNTNTTCGQAGGLAAVSTITFTLAGTCNMECVVDGNLSTTGSQATMRLCVLCDGAWPTDVYGYAFSATAYAWSSQVTTAIDADLPVGPLKGFSLASGSHSCSLYAANTAGTWNFRTASIQPGWRCTCFGQ